MAPQSLAAPAATARREASAWQGGGGPGFPEASVEHASADLVLNAWLGRMSAWLSPAALAGAWQDWASHLLLSPDKQAELLLQGFSNLQRWLQYSAGAMVGDAVSPVRPLAQDKRFADPAWQSWPYNQISQSFLLTQQWWHRATSAVRGVSPHHTDVVTFVARQLLDCVAPSNFVATNPVVQRATAASGGWNLVHGAVPAAAAA